MKLTRENLPQEYKGFQTKEVLEVVDKILNSVSREGVPARKIEAAYQLGRELGEVIA